MKIALDPTCMGQTRLVPARRLLLGEFEELVIARMVADGVEIGNRS